MYTNYSTPKATEARLAFYSDQTDELFKLNTDLQLAVEIAGQYSSTDALYYQEMYTWVNNQYGFVIGNALSFVPSIKWEL